MPRTGPCAVYVHGKVALQKSDADKSAVAVALLESGTTFGMKWKCHMSSLGRAAGSTRGLTASSRRLAASLELRGAAGRGLDAA